jgi:hypothetical protein
VHDLAGLRAIGAELSTPTGPTPPKPTTPK